MENIAAYDAHSAYGSANLQYIWNPGVLDVVVPHESHCNLDYIDYDPVISAPPEYTFSIPNMSSLIERESEFVGKRFLLPESTDVARIKCRVSFSSVRLAFAVYSIGARFVPTLLPRQLLVAVIKQSPPAKDIVLKCDLKEEHFSCGFYYFCNFNYVDKMKNPSDSLAIHLYVRTSWPDLPVSVLRWKADFSNVDIMDHLGVSPFIFADALGFRVQIRMLLRGEQVAAEFRFSTRKIDDISTCSTEFSVKLILINPVNQRLNIGYIFDFHDWFKLDEWNKVKSRTEISTIREIGNVERVLPFLVDNKLMVKIKLIYPE